MLQKSRKNRQEKKQLQDKLQVLEAKEQQMRLERDSMQYVLTGIKDGAY